MKPKNHTQLVIINVAFAALIASCQEAPSTSNPENIETATQPLAKGRPDHRLNAAHRAGDNLGRYKMGWPKRTSGERLARVKNLASQLTQRSLELRTQEIPDKTVHQPFDDGEIDVAYDNAKDDLRIVDHRALSSEKSATDIGEAAARQRASEFADTLVASGVIGKDHFDVKAMKASHLKTMIGEGGTKQDEWVVEYRFQGMRRVNGIEVANAGLTIGISPAGKRSSIRLGGVEVETAAAGPDIVPSLAGSVVERQLDDAELDARFESEVQPNLHKHVAWKRLMYSMPPDVDSAVVEPKLVYRVAMSDDESGSSAIEEPRLVSFSLTNRGQPHEETTAEGRPLPASKTRTK